MKKIIKFIFKLEVLILGFIFLRESLGEVRVATAGYWFPTCFPPCIPTCLPKPTPTEVVPTPTESLPSPGPTSPPADSGVGGPPAGGGPAGPPVCGAQTPPAPYLRSVSKIKYGEVELTWDPVELATHYTISYGPSSGNYLYGVSNTGKVTSFKVGELGGGNYCFVVRAVNDCAPSEPSNELCTGGAVLGVSVLGATGQMTNLFWQILFIMGMACGVVGARNYFQDQKEA